MERLAVEGFGDPTLRLYAPFVNKTKAEIVEIGTKLGVPYEDTWSCYEGGEVYCGLCGTCNERKEAFALAGVAAEDPITMPRAGDLESKQKPLRGCQALHRYYFGLASRCAEDLEACSLSYLASAPARSRSFIVLMNHLRSSRPRSLSLGARICPASFSGSMASTQVMLSSS
jgi:hypothetical protein